MTSKLTRERLLAIADDNSWVKCTHGEVQELARMALAAMDSEPVAVVEPSDYVTAAQLVGEGPARKAVHELYEGALRIGDKLYRHAQPAPVVPEVLQNLRTIVADPRRLPRRKEWIGGQQYSYVLLEEVEALVEGACRAAMLQAEPVCTCPSGDGSLRWPCPVHPGNSPAIPNGYVMVPREPTDEMIAAAMNCEDVLFNSDDSFCVQFGNIYEAMLAASPQPQNAPQNIPEIIPGWIPVSERMPPSRHEVLVGRWWGEKPRWCCKWATYIPGHPDAQSSGWLIPGGSWTPTHWMELPAGPKEVKGE